MNRVVDDDTQNKWNCKDEKSTLHSILALKRRHRTIQIEWKCNIKAYVCISVCIDRQTDRQNVQSWTRVSNISMNCTMCECVCAFAWFYARFSSPQLEEKWTKISCKQQKIWRYWNGFRQLWMHLSIIQPQFSFVLSIAVSLHLSAWKSFMVYVPFYMHIVHVQYAYHLTIELFLAFSLSLTN